MFLHHFLLLSVVTVTLPVPDCVTVGCRRRTGASSQLQHLRQSDVHSPSVSGTDRRRRRGASSLVAVAVQRSTDDRIQRLPHVRRQRPQQPIRHLRRSLRVNYAFHSAVDHANKKVTWSLRKEEHWER